MTPCQHIARRFNRRDDGVIVWKCLVCGARDESATWQQFDHVPASHRYKNAVN